MRLKAARCFADRRRRRRAMVVGPFGFAGFRRRRRRRGLIADLISPRLIATRIRRLRAPWMASHRRLLMRPPRFSEAASAFALAYPLGAGFRPATRRARAIPIATARRRGYFLVRISWPMYRDARRRPRRPSLTSCPRAFRRSFIGTPCRCTTASADSRICRARSSAHPRPTDLAVPAHERRQEQKYDAADDDGTKEAHGCPSGRRAARGRITHPDEHQSTIPLSSTR